MGTLTLSNLNSVHALESPIVTYKLYAIATLECLEPTLLENYVYILAFAPDLRRAFFYSATESFTIVPLSS
jgi:hypothetical protein